MNPNQYQTLEEKIEYVSSEIKKALKKVLEDKPRLEVNEHSMLSVARSCRDALDRFDSLCPIHSTVDDVKIDVTQDPCEPTKLNIQFLPLTAAGEVIVRRMLEAQTWAKENP